MDWDDIDFDDEFEEESDAEEVDDEEVDDEKVDDEEGHSDVDSDGTYICDNCGEEIVIPIDLAGGQEQTYVEDCPVCCCPSVIHVYIDDDRIEVRAEPEQDRY